MSNTNKTRLAFFDHSSATPYQVLIVKEFYIYQDAIDYAESVCAMLVDNGANYAWQLYVYSYDYTSYRYREAGGVLEKTTAVFPNLIG